MPKWDSSEAPVAVTVDEPQAYSGHMDDKPLKLSVEGEPPHPELDHGAVQTDMSPAEAYHFAEDLHAAADACWGGAEYLVTVVHSTDAWEGPLESVLATLKAPDPKEAVRRAIGLVEGIGEREDAISHRVRAELAEENDRFHVYRADTLKAVQNGDVVDGGPRAPIHPDEEQWETIAMVLDDHIDQLYGPPDEEPNDSAREEIQALERLRDLIDKRLAGEA